jgi:hypothetical protein
MSNAPSPPHSQYKREQFVEVMETGIAGSRVLQASPAPGKLI